MALVSVTRGDGPFVPVSGDPAHAAGHRIPLASGAVDGIYAGWMSDGRDVTVEHDRYGFYPLFSWITDERRTIATDISALLHAGAPRTLDFDALSVFLRIGFFLGDDTPFRSIRAVGGARVRRCDGAMLQRCEGATVRTRGEAVDAFIDTFRAAIARRLPGGPFQMPLSGGRDSRHILLALIEAGHPPEACVTVEHFPPRGNDDIAVAADVCRRLGVPHIVVPQHHDRVAIEREKNAATHYCTDEHAQFVPLATWLRQSTSTTYDGIAGDVLSQSSYLTPEAHAVFQRGDPEACARYVLDGYDSMVTERALSCLIAPAILREVSRERAMARLGREIAIHLAAPNPVGSFFFWNRTRREIALSPFALMHGITVYAPYLDWDVFDLFASLPASLLVDRRFHTDAIARAYPHMAEVPYEARTVEPRRRWLQRRLAAGLARIVAVSGGILNARALAPGILATLVDGNAHRLWHASMTPYLGQLSELAALDR